MMKSKEKRRSIASISRKMIFVLLLAAVFSGAYTSLASAAPKLETGREDQIDRFIETRMHQNRIPGLSVAIVHDGEIVYSKGYGETGSGAAVTPDTPLPVASLSKSITALAVMQLVEAGKIRLEDKAADLLPSFRMDDPRGKEITVRQLLNQTSGLADTVFPEMAFSAQPASLGESIARLKGVKLASDPGTAFHYHNTNYQLLALIVETVSKEPFPDYLQKHIFAPLHMDRTTDAALTDSFKEPSHMLLYGQPVALKEPDWFVEGAAGNISTANDMARWLMLQLGEGTYGGARLLSPEGIAAMHEVPAGVESRYGMGWTVDGARLSHNGILWTYQADQLLMPESGYGIVILFGSGLNALVNYGTFASGIADILNGEEPPKSAISVGMIEAGIALLTLLTVLLWVRGFFFRWKRWEHKARQRRVWLTSLRMLVTLIPLAIFISLPQILTFVGGGRVLKWEQIFLLMPSVVIWLALLSAFGAIGFVRKAFCMVAILREHQKAQA
ncbi:serine hydrolase domain-containing protein [Paenibacillus favisporus]|uniref:serine hydrolase domain-containing protein n=1 Tax=Paenibacillus favisporus TaxID=221028 RepID=UPI003D29969C